MGCSKPAWLDALMYGEKFFVGCSIHETAKKNEKNVLCLDCCISMCPHCLPMHRFHRLIQVRRYVYHDVIRLEDLEKVIDCSSVQAYTINSAKVIFIKKRPQNRQFKGAGNYCTSCDRSLQEPYIHCSLGCKVDFVLKHYNDLSPYLRICKTLQLGPDFVYPSEMLEDDMMTNETTPHSTVVDSDDPMSSSNSGGSGSSSAAAVYYSNTHHYHHDHHLHDHSNMNTGATLMCTTEIVRKKRSGLSSYVCGRSANNHHYNKVVVSHVVADHEDMATSMSRRKGIPHRSPLC